jgi:hypothetical protein
MLKSSLSFFFLSSFISLDFAGGSRNEDNFELFFAVLRSAGPACTAFLACDALPSAFRGLSAPLVNQTGAD